MIFRCLASFCPSMGPYSQSSTHLGPIFIECLIFLIICLDKTMGNATQIWKVKIWIGISKVDSWIPDEKLVWHEPSRNYGIIWKWDWFIQPSENWATALCFRRHVFCWNRRYVFCWNRRHVLVAFETVPCFFKKNTYLRKKYDF